MKLINSKNICEDKFLSKQTMKQMKKVVDKATYKGYVNKAMYLIKCRNTFARLNQNPVSKKMNLQQLYYTENDGITLKTTHNYNNYDLNSCSYEDCTPLLYKEYYNDCKKLYEQTLENVSELKM